MDMNRYEKIDGREALKRLADGEEIFSKAGSSYFLRDESNHLWMRTANSMGYAGVSVCEMLTDSWYIPKPFDVRQAMLERPNEWVGAVSEASGKFYKVGFDTDYFLPVIAPFDDTNDPMFIRYERATKAALDNCIPIEDVPENER